MSADCFDERGEVREFRSVYPFNPDGGAGGDSAGTGGAGGIYVGDAWGLDAIDEEEGGGGGGGGANGGEGGHGAVPGGGGGGGEIARLDTGYAARGGSGQVKISWTDPTNVVINAMISNG